MSTDIHHKENGSRGVFFMRGDKGVSSELTYSLKENVMVIDHTETKREFEGQGLASQLLDKAVDYARNKDYKIDPLCPFAEVKFDENSKYSDVRA